MRAMKRTFRSRGWAWWVWRRVANRIGRRVPVLAAAATGISIGPWAAGASTTLSIAGGRARATRAGGNPRISRQVSGLTVGRTYRVQTDIYLGTVGTVFFRVSADQSLTSGDFVNLAGPGAINTTFTAPAGGMVYVGIVGGSSTTDGQYAETNETFTLTGL